MQPKIGIGLALAVTLAVGVVIGRASVDTSPQYEIRTAGKNNFLLYRVNRANGAVIICMPAGTDDRGYKPICRDESGFSRDDLFGENDTEAFSAGSSSTGLSNYGR